MNFVRRASAKKLTVEEKMLTSGSISHIYAGADLIAGSIPGGEISHAFFIRFIKKPTAIVLSFDDWS